MSAKVNGDWELVYSDTFLFRSSPFFWAVGKMMGETSDFFYGAHDHQTGMFGGGVGRVVQSLDLDNNRIVSDCIVKASLDPAPGLLANLFRLRQRHHRRARRPRIRRAPPSSPRPRPFARMTPK